ncbi:MAG TPA: heavy metal-associated domain-containing protein [Ohtaekwangia sp.]
MKKVLLFVFTLYCSATQAQFKAATMEIDGMTCSMCTYGVQRSIAKLKFIQQVNVDLNSSVASISFKPDEFVNIGEVIKSVFDAGYSVRSLKAKVNLENPVGLQSDQFLLGNSTFIILNNTDTDLKGIVDLIFVEKKFTNTDPFKKYKDVIEYRLSNIAIKDHYYFVLR